MNANITSVTGQIQIIPTIIAAMKIRGVTDTTRNICTVAKILKKRKIDMREILFRGKTVCDGDWIYGGITWNPSRKKMFIHSDFEDGEVIPKTIGQFTGLNDKNGLTKIFEYDIIDANGRKVGNYYENSNLLKDGTCFLVAKMGTKEWSRSEQEAIKRGCKYAE